MRVRVRRHRSPRAWARLAALACLLALAAIDAPPLLASLRPEPAHTCPVPQPCCALGLCHRGAHHHGPAGPILVPCGQDPAAAGVTGPVHLPAVLAAAACLDAPQPRAGIQSRHGGTPDAPARPPRVPPPR